MVTKWLIVASLLMVLVGVSLWGHRLREKTPPGPRRRGRPSRRRPGGDPCRQRPDDAGANPAAARLPGAKHQAPAAQPPGTRPTAAASRQPLPKAAVIWTCPMHPQVQSDKPGKCPSAAWTWFPKKTPSRACAAGPLRPAKTPPRESTAGRWGPARSFRRTHDSLPRQTRPPLRAAGSLRPRG